MEALRKVFEPDPTPSARSIPLVVEPTASNAADPSLEQSAKQRPPTPAKPQRLRVAVTDIEPEHQHTEAKQTPRIDLIDLEADAPHNFPPRTAPPAVPSDPCDTLSGSESRKSSLRAPSPLGNLTSALRTVSQSTSAAAKQVQSGASKTFQGITARPSKASSKERDDAAKDDEPKDKDFQRFVNSVKIPKAFKKTGEDLSDLGKLWLRKPDLCSNCAKLPLEACFGDVSGKEGYSAWNTPLSRVILHADWCRVCKFLLSMLFRPEHDPLRSDEVQKHIKPEWLRGLPFKTWYEDEYIKNDDYWPFGRSEHRHEGALHVVGPFVDNLKKMALPLSLAGLKAYSRSPGAEKPIISPDDVDVAGFWGGYFAGKKSLTRYPFSCVIWVVVSGKQTPTPGLCRVEVIGCSNKLGSEARELSRFMFRAVRSSLSVHVSEQNLLSYGHVLEPYGIDMEMGKLWMTECETRHGRHCESHGWSIAIREPFFLRLLDLDTLSIVIAPDPGKSRYVALSYVWGSDQTLKLCKSNVHEISQLGGLKEYLQVLPQTILDAMEVVKDLGERYLWVDSLCIPQGSTESEQQIKDMYTVFGNALLTIVAGDGVDANSGLSGIRRRWFAPERNHGRSRSIHQPIAGFKNYISIIAPYATQHDVRDSPWNTRAWTLQERLLSRRLLIFAKDEVVWYCRSSIAREDMPVEGSGYPVQPLQWLSLRPQYFGDVPNSHWQDGSFVKNRHGFTHVVRSGTFAEYAKVIAQYTGRKMSLESDAVNALAGLLEIFSICFQAECIHGLPASLLDVALLWRPLEPLIKRDSSLGFPSWSWAAWKGRIEYGEQIKIKQDESGTLMKTEGIRPMLRYFRVEERNHRYLVLKPLNGTGRGVPLADDGVPQEWEASPSFEGCHSGVSTCKTPGLLDLDCRTIREIYNRADPKRCDRHLVFWTSTSDVFNLNEVKGPQDSTTPIRMNIHSSTARSFSPPVGNVLLDSHGPLRLTKGVHRFILIAEAQSSLMDHEQPREAKYAYYVVMLVETDRKTGILSRLGIGRISKGAWLQASPSLKLVCLG